VGWLIGPESIIKPTLAASTRIVFCSNSPLQEAAAAGLERAKAHNFFPTQTKEYAERRDVLVKVFDDLGLKYTLPQGSYFVLLVCRLAVLTSPRYIPSSLMSPESVGYIRS
jgi:kynurenine aminotransferase